MDPELAFAPATEIRRMIAAGEISSVELTELFYQRIDELNPRLSAYLALCPDQALADARAADAGSPSAATPWGHSTASLSPSRTWNLPRA